MKAIGEHFGLYYSCACRIVAAGGKAKGKTKGKTEPYPSSEHVYTKYLRTIKMLAMSKFVAVLVLVFLIPGSCMLGMHPRVGWFPESNFELSPESRFPGWFSNQQGYDRSKVTVWIYYYAPPFGSTNFKAELVELGSERRVLESKYGESKWHPITKQKLDSGVDYYPSFHVVNVEGLKELVEHRKMEPIFYISDDREMKKSVFVHK